MNNEKVYLKDLIHFSPKQHEARKQALKDGVPEARAEGHRS
jgi:hypothetical protein